jgi:acetyl/propionyl-CoA carboxylase alpha subunit
MAAKYRLKLGKEDHELEVEPDGADGYRIKSGDVTSRVSLRRIDDSARYSVIIDGRPHDVFAEEGPTGFHIVIGGRTIEVGTQTGRRGRGGPDSLDIDDGGEWVLKSPMAGVVQDVRVRADDEVEQSQVLVVVEAMKMQNELRARRGGTVKAVYVTVGQRVEQGTPLLVLL